MAKTNAERQRDYRLRRAGGGHPGPKCPGCRMRAEAAAEAREELARWKDEARRWGARSKDEISALEAEVSRLTDELEAAHADLVSAGKRCASCGGELACPQCSRGQQGYDDF